MAPVYALRNGEPTRAVKRVFMHISARDPRTGDIFEDAEQIRDYHKNVRGWRDIGYHWVVTKDGKVEKGRPEWQIGAHARGHNRDSIAICLCAADGLFTVKQLRMAKRLVWVILKHYHLSLNDLHGHYEVNDGKTCPDFAIENFRGLIREL